MRTASNMFIVNLAIFDLLMMLEMPMFIANSFQQRLLGYDLGCTIYAALGSLSGILLFFRLNVLQRVYEREKIIKDELL